jgi:hypothetical protein
MRKIGAQSEVNSHVQFCNTFCKVSSLKLNNRIERFWRDVFYGCLSHFKSIFIGLEEEGLLNVEDSRHLLLLQWVFLPRLNFCLNEFREGWNEHPLSTEHNYTPNQLMLLNSAPGFADMQRMHITGSPETDVNTDEDLILFDNVDSITNPVLGSIDPSLINLDFLRGINPFRESNENGCDIYIEALQAIN